VLKHEEACQKLGWVEVWHNVELWPLSEVIEEAEDEQSGVHRDRAGYHCRDHELWMDPLAVGGCLLPSSAHARAGSASKHLCP
jgi:hypothetical protein